MSERNETRAGLASSKPKGNSWVKFCYAWLNTTRLDTTNDDWVTAGYIPKDGKRICRLFRATDSYRYQIKFSHFDHDEERNPFLFLAQMKPDNYHAKRERLATQIESSKIDDFISGSFAQFADNSDDDDLAFRNFTVQLNRSVDCFQFQTLKFAPTLVRKSW